MNTSYTVEDLVPHSGAMSLLTDITGVGPNWLSARIQITPDSMFAEQQGVPSWIGLEYMAQAVAAFSGANAVAEGNAPKIGLLLGSRSYEASSNLFVLGDTLNIRVEEEVRGDNNLSIFTGELQGTLGANPVQAHAQINVFEPEDALEFLGCGS